jgi:hypothetical protein
MLSPPSVSFLKEQAKDCYVKERREERRLRSDLFSTPAYKRRQKSKI